MSSSLSFDGRTPLQKNDRLEEQGGIVYVIEKVLSKGGAFGITYLATEHFIDPPRQVVIKENYPIYTAQRDKFTLKLIPRANAKDFFDTTREKFLKEAQILRHLKHPNIVHVYTVFGALGTAYYVMPYLEGSCELGAAAPKNFNETWLLNILRPLLGALSHLHSRKLQHRDIKPDNILLTPEGTPILIDFGLACMGGGDGDDSQGFGSAGYSPPEQGSTSAGFCADLYSLGATCYKLITGSIPPPAFDRHNNDPYKPLNGNRELLKRFSSAMLAGIDRALKMEPKERWQNAQEWLDSLKHLASTPAPKSSAREIAREKLAQQGIPPQTYNSNLLAAAQKGTADRLKLLLSAGANVNTTNTKNQTPLYLAAEHGHRDCLQLLLTKPEIDLNRVDNLTGSTALCRAAYHAHCDCLKALIVRPGIDINHADNTGATPLHLATARAALDCVRALLSKPGININQADNKGKTPLSLAKTEDVKRLLRAAGAR